MTEKEARARWCPFTRVLAWNAVGATAVNRWQPEDDKAATAARKKGGDVVAPVSSFCIASDCMMWTGTDCGLKHASQS